MFKNRAIQINVVKTKKDNDPNVPHTNEPVNETVVYTTEYVKGLIWEGMKIAGTIYAAHTAKRMLIELAKK